MKRIILILCIVTPFSYRVHGQEQKNEEQSITNTDKIFCISKFWSDVKYNFVYYDKLKFDFDSLYHASLEYILNTENEIDYYRELMRFAATLNDGHTEIIPPLQVYSKYWATIPLRTKIIEDRIFVRDVKNDTLITKGITKGTEILKINGMDVHQYVQRYIIPYISSSTERYKKVVAYNSELTKGDINEPVIITFRDQEGQIFEEIISRQMTEKEDWLTKYKGSSFEDMLNHPKFRSIQALIDWDLSTPYHFKKLNDNIGYLQITHFMGNTKDFDHLYGQIKETNALIIDLRGNLGGNSDIVDHILKHFTDKQYKSFRWISRKHIPVHVSWGIQSEWIESNTNPIQPFTKEDNKEIYMKPVVVLTDERTISSAEDFCVGFRSMKRGKIIGGKTAGSSGNPLQLKMPDDSFAWICTLKVTMPDGTDYISVGVLPDIEVKETIEAFLAGNDLVLEEGLAIIVKKF
ncbi:S41 family peptidase [Proteiniphilum acetatigenes]|uniref:S41 family peptidase n=1 Tax=Proteiniphilum acetatigenes TaxID=294710 RepID=UPI000382D694|nr:S41 family peptidase [Proteiniphilum acetatigenes]SFL47605.1 C-terminal processing protease CtpA/Prc, contains a PDZ domain [Porphyromonadaceae bacterium KH3CP3RA]